MPVTAVRHRRSIPRLAARSVRMRCNVVRRTPRPDALLGKGASTERPEARNRMPENGCVYCGDRVTPSRRSAAMPSGIKPSPQALSIGGSAPSATATANPCCRAAIAAASPAGPPPITKTSVESNNSWTSPLQEQKFRAESWSHRREQAQSPRFGATVLHDVLQHYEHGS